MPDLDDIPNRLHQLENIVFDIPNILNIRLDAFKSMIDANGSRLGQIEKTLGMLQTDVRDMRSGVTFQLRLQMDDLARFAVQLKTQDERLGGVEQRLERIEGLLGAIAAKLDIKS